MALSQRLAKVRHGPHVWCRWGQRNAAPTRFTFSSHHSDELGETVRSRIVTGEMPTSVLLFVRRVSPDESPPSLLPRMNRVCHSRYRIGWANVRNGWKAATTLAAGLGGKRTLRLSALPTVRATLPADLQPQMLHGSIAYT